MSKDAQLDRLDALDNKELEFAQTKKLIGNITRVMLEGMDITAEQTEAIIHDMTMILLPKAKAATRQARSEIFTEEELATLADFGESNPSIITKLAEVLARSSEISKHDPKDIMTIVAKHVPHLRDEIAEILAEQ